MPAGKMKGGRVEKGKRKKKDPNAPKRAMSAYFWFMGEERDKVKKVHPDWGIGDVAKELGRRWAGMTAGDKKRFEDMAAKDKTRYEKESAAYKAKGHHY